MSVLNPETKKKYQYIKKLESLGLAADPILFASVVTDVIQDKLDSFAKSKNYDGILSACSYVTSSVPTFKTEAEKCVLLRDSVWAKCYEIMAAVQTGARPLPKIDQLLEELPTFAW